jgi:ribonuclease J
MRELQSSKDLFLAPLGGLGEIGMNMMALIYQGQAVILDCGAMFPESNLMGADIIVPKVDFFKEYDLEVIGLVLTHGHEDHIGGVAFLYEKLGRPKIYATEFTMGMLESRLKEHTRYKSTQFHPYRAREKFSVGPFEFEPLYVTHSLVDCFGFAIRTPVGLLAHTGDFKIDREPLDNLPMDEARFKELGDEGVLLMMSDSTNVESVGWNHTEKEVKESIQKLIGSIRTGKIVVTLFSSNIHRLQALFDIAAECGRRVVLCGRSVATNVDLASRLGYLKFNPQILLDSRDVDAVAAEKVLILCTGTQAEPRSALTKMSQNHHPDISLHKGDTVIFSSRHIPGNERKISGLMNNLHRLGARVIDSREEFVHVSGHARKEELEHIQQIVRPKNFLPVHGEYRMLVKHFELAQRVRPETQGLVAENGDLLRLNQEGLSRVTRIDHGKQNLDENRNFLEEKVLRERKKIAHSGLIIVHMVLREKDHSVVEGPDFTSYGLPEEIDWVALEDEILRSVKDFSRSKKFDLEGFEDEVSIITRRAFRKVFGIKPQVFSSIYVN